MNYYKQIVSYQNIKDAYCDIKEKFFNPVSGQYALGQLARGIDGVCFAIFQKGLHRKLKCIQDELKTFQNPLPSIDLKIPKSSNPNKFRTISISSLKEKVKHHAVCRVIEPVLESLYEDNLYSYRQGSGAYKAMKDFRKAILYDGADYYIYKVDMKDYFDNLDHKIVLQIVQATFKDSNLTKLISVFLNQRRLAENELFKSDKGVVQGISISAHLANLYLLELDKEMKAKGVKYFRVGDDIIILHTDKDRLKEIADEVERFLIVERKLPLNKEKTKLYERGEAFEYLGYEIKGKTISVARKNCEKMKQKIRNKLNKKLTAKIDRKTVDKELLLSEIMQLIIPGKRIPDHIMWLRYFTLMNNEKQLKEIDDFIENRIRMLFFGKKRNKNYTKLPLSELRKHKYVSLSQIYHDITNGRKSFTDYVIHFTK
jgi:group II intron reverse transcriptase/maturase